MLKNITKNRVSSALLLGVVFGLSGATYAAPKRSVRTTPIIPAAFSRSPGSSQAAFAQAMDALRSKRDLEIPIKSSPDTIRIATYNVQEELKSQTPAYIASQLKSLSADIIMLQAEAQHVPGLIKICTKLGYSHYTRLDGQIQAGAGSIIASKLPLTVSVSKKHAQKTAGSPARFYVKVELDLSKYSKKNLVLYGVYLDGQDGAVRLAQAQELVASVHRHDQGKNVIIGGDFNEGSGAATNYLGSQGFIDSFDLAGVAKPTFTHWSRQVLDRLYVNRKSWNIWLDGAFVFYPGARHHTPVIMDIDLAGN